MGSQGNVTGVILAGGLARRMGGGDKALIELSGKPLLDHVITRLGPQVDALVLNANGDRARFSTFNLPVVSDPIEGPAGPLAGVLAGLEWACENVADAQWVVTVATDTPFFPKNLVSTMMSACKRQGADMACAASNGRAHPVFGLWPVRLAGDLRHALIDEEVRKVDLWTQRFRVVEVEFEHDGIDPFFNINRREDIDRAQAAHRKVVA